VTTRPGPERPQRIVSLVPSLTEALFVLGLGERVVGVTDWCVHPAAGVAPLPKLGGTKNPDLKALAALRPDLVIANHEENTRRDVERMQAEGLAVWVTYPRTVEEGAELLAEIAALGAAPDASEKIVTPVLASLQEAKVREAKAREAEGALAGAEERPRVFCPVWRDPWMAVGRDTYAHDLIRLCGGANVFGERSERRYPIVKLAEIEAARPDVILLPDEPYAFGPRDVAELSRLDAPAAGDGRIHLLDGTLLSWYGPRIRRALDTLRPLLQPDP